MAYLVTAIAIITLAILSILVLRIRVTGQASDERQFLFVGIGRSGIEYDFLERIGAFRLLGLKVKHISIEEYGPRTESGEKPTKKKRRVAQIRLSSLPKLLSRDVDPIKALKDAVDYVKAVFRVTKVEEFEGLVTAGFDSPYDTGIMYGYYQAFQSALPRLFGRLSVYPSWTEPMLVVRGRLSLAAPCYSIIYYTGKLYLRLKQNRIRKIKNTRRKGKQDDK